MTIYDFTTNLDRRHTNSIKWRVKDGELPLTIADMDFRVAPEIEAAMQAKVARGNFGYEYTPDEYFTAVASWYQQEHGVDVDPAWMQYVSGLELLYGPGRRNRHAGADIQFLFRGD